MSDFIAIEGRKQAQLPVSAAGAQTAPLEKGVYDVWCDVDVWLKVEDYTNVTPDRAQDVTAANGYKLFAGNTVPVDVDMGRCIGAIAGGAGTLSYHRVG